MFLYLICAITGISAAGVKDWELETTKKRVVDFLQRHDELNNKTITEMKEVHEKIRQLQEADAKSGYNSISKRLIRRDERWKDLPEHEAKGMEAAYMTGQEMARGLWRPLCADKKGLFNQKESDLFDHGFYNSVELSFEVEQRIKCGIENGTESKFGRLMTTCSIVAAILVTLQYWLYGLDFFNSVMNGVFNFACVWTISRGVWSFINRDKSDSKKTFTEKSESLAGKKSERGKSAA